MSFKSLTELQLYLLNQFGLNFSQLSSEELYKKIAPAAIDFNYSNTNDFINWLINTKLNKNQQKLLASHLTIGETYFFREVNTLKYLENDYLPKLISSRKNSNKRIGIWSAGCATGEEPYTLAILLRKVIKNINDWDIQILATDINKQFIEKAKKGIYSDWSFRKLPKSFKQNNFNEVKPDKYQINSAIQKMVKFSYLNLATETFPTIINNTHPIDIIFCRNVLIYFSNSGIRKVTNKLYNSLLNGGILVVSAVEMSNLISQKFQKIRYSGNTIYCKNIGNQKTKSEIISTNKTIESNNVIIPIRKKSVKRINQSLSNELKRSKNQINNVAKTDYCEKIKSLVKEKANAGKLVEAIELCEKAIKTNKLSANLYFLKSTIQQEQGNYLGALDSLKRVIYIDPDFVLAHFALGNLCSKLGFNEQANKHYLNTNKILATRDSNDIVEESEGLTVARLSAIVKSILI